MNYEEMCKILNNPKATKEKLREALSFALGVEYVPFSKEKEETLFSKCKKLFCDFYGEETGLNYIFTGQDGKTLSELINKVKGIAQGYKEEEILATLEFILRNMPAWYKKNAFSIPVINKKFNEIVANIKQYGKGQISSDYKQKLLNDLQS